MLTSLNFRALLCHPSSPSWKTLIECNWLFLPLEENDMIPYIMFLLKSSIAKKLIKATGTILFLKKLEHNGKNHFYNDKNARL